MRDPHGALLHWSVHPGCYPSEGAMHYVRNGREIPDLLLPGRALMRMGPEERAAIVKAINQSEPATWWVKVMCG